MPIELSVIIITQDVTACVLPTCKAVWLAHKGPMSLNIALLWGSLLLIYMKLLILLLFLVFFNFASHW